ncbi:hypothetical protein ACFVDT_03685 [Streptomyces sp. NPDC057699]|uniref:hypothetical protein n=1 Tax=Streptomyces sp. NPDC057699 TaxID=3346220 RepID=UPI00368E5280
MQVFSAAFTAHIEATYHSQEVKNELCMAAQRPNADLEHLRYALAISSRLHQWSSDVASLE